MPDTRDNSIRGRLRRWAGKISKQDYLSDVDDRVSVAELKTEMARLYKDLDEAWTTIITGNQGDGH